MPRRNHLPQRKRRMPYPEPEHRPANYEAMARSLVRRGLASEVVLDRKLRPNPERETMR